MAADVSACEHLLLKEKGVHETGSTPNIGCVMFALDQFLGIGTSLMRDRAKKLPFGSAGQDRVRAMGDEAEMPLTTFGPRAADTVAYIADLSDQLATMARGAGEPVLGYLLDMARVEAEAIARRRGERGPSPG